MTLLDDPAIRAEVAHLVDLALDEDLRYGPDITTDATVPAGAVATAAMRTRQPGIVAGIDVALHVLDVVVGADNYEVISRVADGTQLAAGDSALVISGPVHGLLVAERTMLNFVCHLSGIATATADWVRACEGTSARVRDSRKTLAGWRALQKYAVRAGGGVNHRMGLGDEALIKDNHVVAAGGVAEALQAVRTRAPGVTVEVEVDSLEQLDAVLARGAEIVLLDNFPVWQTQIAVQRRDAVSPSTLLESSGGLSLDVAAEYAATGVNYLAVGALTHSVRVLDLGLDM